MKVSVPYESICTTEACRWRAELCLLAHFYHASSAETGVSSKGSAAASAEIYAMMYVCEWDLGPEVPIIPYGLC